jgi:hypothetical protein|tara:strand:- start:645 stop:851 length:207 start_codon:yes stop_codon:yes gene_type:complete
MLSKQCRLHLKETGMSGPQHMVHALKIAIRLQKCVFVVIIHSIAPRYFRTTATDIMREILNEQPKLKK